MANRIKPHEVRSVITEYIENSKKKSSVKDLEEEGCFLISLKHFDRNQSPTFSDWEQNMMLSEAIEVIAGYCQLPLKEQVDGKKFVIYGDFPKHSKFTFPTYVPPDANWARIHINGLHVLAGHVVKNIFYIVFMDNSHSFWEME